MLYLRGGEYSGAYAYNDIDEVAYASYLRALIDGRPRKNDPYTGRDHTPETPQEESLFSIQFFAPYVLAIPGRVFGLSPSTMMILGGALAGFFAALAAFFVIGRITENSLYAMAGAIAVLAGGALAAGEGAIVEIMGGSLSYPYFPFLRRYIPAIPFPIFFLLFGAIWALLGEQNQKKRRLLIIAASLCFAALVFSYFYLWTAAAAWLVIIPALLLVLRPENFQRDLESMFFVGIGCLLSLLPYAYLLSLRSHTMDHVQLLNFTREPDLWRMPSIICYATLALLIAALIAKFISLKDKATLFAFAFALAPILAFNQQIITGRSLQPIHYQVFCMNYVAAAALVITLGIILKQTFNTYRFASNIAITALALLAIVWGFVECHYTVRVLDEANVARDDGMLVAKRLEELSSEDAPSPGANRAVVFSISMLQGDDSPTVAPQAVLWARHQHVFPGVTWKENKERYYQTLYYMGLDEKWLGKRLGAGDFVSMIALFGWGRHTDRLSSDAKPLTYFEIDEEARIYGEYYRNFALQQAAHPTISYVVVPTDWNADLSNFDKWYVRDEGEKLGGYTLYKCRLKTEAELVEQK